MREDRQSQANNRQPDTPSMRLILEADIVSPSSSSFFLLRTFAVATSLASCTSVFLQFRGLF